jgi:hypothetical protein
MQNWFATQEAIVFLSMFEIARKWKNAIPFQLHTMYFKTLTFSLLCKLRMSTRPTSIIRNLEGKKIFLEEGLPQFLNTVLPNYICINLSKN